MKQGRLRGFFTDRNISLIIRWWAAGAVYFFIGWGTYLGTQQTLIDFVFVLGVVMGLFNILIVNPVLRMAFNITPRRPKRENTSWQRISDYIVQFLMTIFIVLIVALIYIIINEALVNLLALPADAIPLPGEPILFGLFYVLVYILLGVISRKIKEAIVKSRNRKAK